MIADKGCFERGCACHDSRDGGGVEMVRKEWQGLTDEEIFEVTPGDDKYELYELFRAIEAKLKEKNT